jgi:hypothetical protein
MKLPKAFKIKCEKCGCNFLNKRKKRTRCDRCSKPDDRLWCPDGAHYWTDGDVLGVGSAITVTASGERRATCMLCSLTFDHSLHVMKLTPRQRVIRHERHLYEYY